MSNNQFPSDVQFAGLIQAATAAAETQEHNANTSILGKRQRSPDENLIDTQLRAGTGSRQANESAGQLPSIASTLYNSASILFREPSEKSKKYSRPPLGKVYKDLELAPQRFIDLQEAAKDYMLDEDHMERRNVVGHKKHSSNNDIAKLRLWGCVESFLGSLNKGGDMNNGEVMNNGEWWFGRNAGIDDPHAPPIRTFFWPEDSQKIMKLCMPLFRKMVTNERQRLYALETRKHDPNKSDKNDETDTTVSRPHPAQHSHLTANSPPMIDLTLENTGTGQDLYLNNGHSHDAVIPSSLRLYISVTSSVNDPNVRLGPRFSTTTKSVSSFTALIDQTRRYHTVGQVGIGSQEDWMAPVVKVWLPEGLVCIKDEEQWMIALLRASMFEWMDLEVRVIIEIGHTSDLINVD